MMLGERQKQVDRSNKRHSHSLLISNHESLYVVIIYIVVTLYLSRLSVGFVELDIFMKITSMNVLFEICLRSLLNKTFEF